MLKKQAEEAAEREREAHRAQGTPVTKESFAKWLAAFAAEQAEAAAPAAAKAEEGEARCTGKAWFQERYTGEGDDGTDALEQELVALDVEGDDGGGGAGGLESDDEGESGSDDSDEDFLDDFLAEAHAHGGAAA